MLTYSVHQSIAKSQKAEDFADFVRKEMANFDDDWDKVDHIETTFTGILTANGVSEAGRKEHARKQICEKIEPILDRVPAQYRPTVNVALMLESNGKFIEFAL
ncbi:hypothetical protein [Pseudomonas sp. Pseu.R1]|uniref:hypothetical protein n=1 Tax=Pseudomonas sp. Pseu.R1 TaxID=3379818 RepID=UPI003B932DCA